MKQIDEMTNFLAEKLHKKLNGKIFLEINFLLEKKIVQKIDFYLMEAIENYEID